MAKKIIERIALALTQSERIELLEFLLKDTTVKPISTPAFSDLDFTAIYKMYPKKQGKVTGLLRLRRLVKSPETYEKLLQATNNYNAYIKNNRIEMKYVMQFSTFANRYQDWTNDALGEALVTTHKLPDFTNLLNG